MGIRVLEESFPLVWVLFLGFVRAQTIPDSWLYVAGSMFHQSTELDRPFRYQLPDTDVDLRHLRLLLDFVIEANEGPSGMVGPTTGGRPDLTF